MEELSSSGALCCIKKTVRFMWGTTPSSLHVAIWGEPMMGAQTSFLRNTILQQVTTAISLRLVQSCLDSCARLCAIKVCQMNVNWPIWWRVGPNFGISEWNTTACLVNTASAVKEVTVDHYKRPASSGFPDILDCKRMKQEEQSKTC